MRKLSGMLRDYPLTILTILPSFFGLTSVAACIVLLYILQMLGIPIFKKKPETPSNKEN